HESTPFTEIKISDEDREAIIDVGSRPDLLQLMQRSIAPSIYATGVVHYVKRSLALQLFGGVSRINKDATRSRGDVHILLMGDPGVAKSQLLNYMSKLSPRGMFATGGGVSGAGLTAAAVRDDFGGGGRFALEAGILPLSDRGMAAIDEFDKISEEDRRTMHPAMEQQRLDVSKGGVKATLNTRCAVLAAANPIRGRFTKRGANESVMHSFNETGLPPALASRFDIIWMLRDEVRVDDDERIGRHILEIRTQGISESKIDEAMELDLREADEGLIYDKGVDGSEHLTVEFLRKFIAYAKRNIHPDLNTDAKALILDYYTKERQSFGRDEQQYAETEVIPITPRALEGLIRLTEAHARMHLREIATADDAKMAMAIFRHWREEAGIEDESELMSGVSVSQRNAGNVVRAVLRDLCTDKGVAELTNILNRCENRGVKNFQVEEVLSNMLQSGELFSPRIEEYSFAR
ncbi:minichromosome maintenance protein MCM, partial [Candidatus Poseidoniales archaeon]|nr:minichromosome maintenance protein MCM [Candidatus Poseidoniales archaeon]